MSAGQTAREAQDHILAALATEARPSVDDLALAVEWLNEYGDGSPSPEREALLRAAGWIAREVNKREGQRVWHEAAREAARLAGLDPDDPAVRKAVRRVATRQQGRTR
jgi:hypothetical protein